MRAARAAAAAVALCVGVLVACEGSPRSQPSQQDRDAEVVGAINSQLSLRTGHENVRAIVALVHGKTVLARYDGVSTDRTWDIGWGTAAVVATLVGIAIDDGDIAGLEATLGDLLPDRAAAMSPAVARVTLREVLTMTGGFRGTRTTPVFDYASAADPVGDILRAAEPKPARPFAYSSEGAHVLAAVLRQATGMPVLEYARSKLFDPLGIDTTPAFESPVTPKNLDAYEAAGFAWPVDATGLQLGWSSLKLAPADVAKIGQLYLDRGRWKGRQLVSSSWVHESSAVQEDNVAQPTNTFSGWGGYGYGWWQIESDSSPAFFVADLTGQLLEVLPTHSLVVVVASEPDYDAPASGLAPNNLTFLVSDVIAPAYSPDASGE